MELPQNRTNQDLRKFGFVVGGVFGAIAGYLFYRNGMETVAGKILGGIAAPLLILAVVYPRALAPVERVWMRIALVLGWINTRLILGVLFFTVVSLTRFYLFLTRKDPMTRKLDPALATYWTDLPQEFDPKSYEDPF